jgi:hypothetical protein
MFSAQQRAYSVRYGGDGSPRLAVVQPNMAWPEDRLVRTK